jgi:hypothetical protein
MKSKLRVVEVQNDKTIELPDNAIPIRLDQVVEPTGLVNPAASSEKFVLYYLEKVR